MNKKFWTVLLALVAVLAMSMTAFAASGVSADEQALLDKFGGVVDKWAAAVEATGDSRVAQYKGEAENALTKVELDKAACDDLAATIDAVDKLLTDKNVKTKADLKAAADEVVALVNKTSQKYNMTVQLSAKEEAKVLIGNDVAASNKGLVNKTGADLTATAVVVLILAAAFATGLVLVRRQRTAAR